MQFPNRKSLVKNSKYVGRSVLWVQDDLLRRFLKNAAILFSGNIVSSIFGLASMAITARALGVKKFGILVLIVTYVGIVDKLVNFQSWQAIIKYGADLLEENKKEKFKLIIKFGFLLDCTTALLGAMIAASIAWFVGQWMVWNNETVIMTALYSVTIIFNISGTPTAILRLFDKFNKIACRGIIASGIKLFGVLIAFSFEAKIWIFLLVWGVVDILGKMILLYFGYQELVQKEFHNFIQADLKNITKRFKGIWGFVITTNLNSSIRMATRELDVMLIASMLGPTSVGLYKIAKQFSLVIQRTIEPMYQSIFPELAKLISKGAIKDFIRFSVRSSVLAFVFAIGIWLVFYFFGDIVIIMTVGSDYLNAINVMLWYMFAIVLAASAFPLQPAMLSIGLPHITFWVHIISTMVYFSALFFLVKKIGLVGAGISYFIYYFVWSFLMLVIEFIVIHRMIIKK